MEVPFVLSPNNYVRFAPPSDKSVMAWRIVVERRVFRYRRPEAVWRLMRGFGTDEMACGYWDTEYEHVATVRNLECGLSGVIFLWPKPSEGESNGSVDEHH